jgi:dihydrofolate synthase/folylpolyglutamate synthase
VILSRCRECDIAPRFPTSEMRVLGADEAGRLRVTFTTAQDVYENIQLSLPGRHQATNAATALALAEVLRERGLPLTSAAIIEGLETTRHAGRLELLPGTPSLLFDGAHNAAGALALRAYLDEFISTPVTMIFGAMKDKDLREIAATLFPCRPQADSHAPHQSARRFARLTQATRRAAIHRQSSRARRHARRSPAHGRTDHAARRSHLRNRLALPRGRS